jgi:hypothetical protein
VRLDVKWSIKRKIKQKKKSISTLPPNKGTKISDTLQTDFEFYLRFHQNLNLTKIKTGYLIDSP